MHPTSQAHDNEKNAPGGPQIATTWSVAHISPQGPQAPAQAPENDGFLLTQGGALVCDIHADMLRLRKPGDEADDHDPAEADEAPAPGGKRGVIVGMSRASRLRLLRLLASCRRSPAAFLTLTYPDDYPEDWPTFKRHLDSYIKRLKRRIPGIDGLWKLEPQGRGAPHYHLMIWAPIGASEGRVLAALGETDEQGHTWAARAWVEVTGSGGGDGGWHYVYGADIERMTDRKKAYAYLSKYIAKTSDDDDAPGRDEDARDDDTDRGLFAWGRWWGRWGGSWDTSTSAAVGITTSAAVELRRLVKRWLKAQARQRKPRGAAGLRRLAARLGRQHPAQGWTVFGLGDGGYDDRLPDPAQVLRLIDHAARLADQKPALAHRLAAWGNRL